MKRPTNIKGITADFIEEMKIPSVQDFWKQEETNPKIYLHLFHVFGFDWYIAAATPLPEHNDIEFYGYAKQAKYPDDAEWGCFWKSQLAELKMSMFNVENEFCWSPIRFDSIDFKYQ